METMKTNRVALGCGLLLLPGLALGASVAEWPLPAPAGSTQPNLSLASDGDLLLSWIERRKEGGHRLAFARQDAATGWTAAQTIADGRPAENSRGHCGRGEPGQDRSIEGTAVDARGGGGGSGAVHARGAVPLSLAGECWDRRP